MGAIAFDSLLFAKRLKAAGFTKRQAEVQAEAIQDIVENDLATKRDLKELEMRFELKFKEIEQKIVIKMGAMLFAQTGLFIAIVALFLK